MRMNVCICTNGMYMYDSEAGVVVCMLGKYKDPVYVYEFNT
jgi:hypothetical protein